MRYHKSVVDAIGNTPLISLSRMSRGLKPKILAKFEAMNPGGSVKDRIGIAMIEDAERRGLLKPGGTIVEPTSGNTGVGLAMVAAVKGYKTIFVMPDKMSIEKELLLRAYGAKVVRTPSNVPSTDPRSNHKVAEQIVKETPDAYMPNQYENLSNPNAHYATTGPEIWIDTDGKVTCVVAGIGTGGTISGVARYLKEKNPKIKVVGADPEGSVYGPTLNGRKAQPSQYKVEGIGEDFVPGALDMSLLDEIVTVSDHDAFHTARRLVREEGLLAGGSSGCATWAALQVSRRLSKNDVVVVLLPDTGRNYLSTFLSDEWLEKNGLA